MSQDIAKRNSFNPCELFPARIKGKKFTAKPQESGTGRRGSTDLKKHEVTLPMGNNAYDRTVRLHEALHAIHSPKNMKPEDVTMLGQALEDARLHLNLAKTSGHVRRDEIATALTDIRRGAGDKNLAALLALRSAAILASHDVECHLGAWEDKSLDGSRAHVSSRYRDLCEQISPDYRQRVHDALERIQRNEMSDARRILEPYFDSTEPPTSTFPSMGKGDGEDAPKGTFKDISFSFDKMEGKLTSDAADMLSNSTVDSINTAKDMPKLFIRPLFASHMIPTFFGETQKHVIVGCKIHAKKLATIVGPHSPRIFLKTIRRNGGTVLIDASGSMSLTPEQLLKLIVHAPAATIAFYNAPDDYSKFGNLWVFSHKGKRALDFREVNLKDEFYCDNRGRPKRDARGHLSFKEDAFGSGNVVDFQALQWLLAQAGPRYVLTDGEFTGPYASKAAARELLRTAIARKKLTQITSLKEMEKVLVKGASNV